MSDELFCDRCEELIDDADDESRGPLVVCGVCAEVIDDHLAEDIEQDPPSRTFTITITSSHPDARELVREAAEKIACEIGWGDDQHYSVEACDTTEPGPPEYLSGWVGEPGNEEVENDA